MKKLLSSLLMIAAAPALSFALNQTPTLGLNAEALFVPPSYLSSAKTAKMEWGCPVSEVVEATSSQEAVTKISQECIEEALQASRQKPGVLNVIQSKVIWPDINVMKESNGFKLQGTFFIETLVFQQ